MRVLRALLTMAAATALTGCGGSVDHTELAGAVGPTFARLYALHQHQRGHDVSPGSVGAAATCGRAGSTDTGTGVGDDWRCAITYRSGRHSVPALATYSVQVKPNGCFTADGDEPAELVSAPTVTRADGVIVPNLLWQIEGCFDPS
jgi:ABC-2 type transport system permease protein